jgi:colanic acid biosynthesis glycosyl transferase WcaI
MAANLRAFGIPDDRIRVIPNWCDDTAIRPASESNNPLRGAWSLEGKFVVGYSGNLGRAHEFETILGAASRLWSEPGIVFLIIGGGHFVEAFARRVKQLHLDQKFQFLPYQDQATLNYSLGVPNLHWISLKPELEGLIVPSKFYSIAAVGRPMVVIGAGDGELATLVRRHHCGYVNPVIPPHSPICSIASRKIRAHSPKWALQPEICWRPIFRADRRSKNGKHYSAKWNPRHALRLFMPPSPHDGLPP